jgi:Fic family protein
MLYSYTLSVKIFTESFTQICIASKLSDAMQPFEPKTFPLEGIAWDRLVPAIARANRELARYDGILHGVPNPAVLLSPLTTQEAVVSSRIEGTQATLGEVLKFEAGEEVAGEARRQDIHEILNYRKAMHEADKELKTRPFNLNLLKSMHAVLLDSVRGKSKARGEFRRDQNWIGTFGEPIEKALFVPPAPDRVMPLLDEWEKYWHAEERDALVQLALIHAQFEIIHPFLDGNGRLGRIQVPLFLYEKKLLTRPMFYLSAYLDTNKDQYVARLRALNGPESWNHWIEFFLTAIAEQAVENAEKAKAVLALYEDLKSRVLELTHSQYAVPLLDRLFRQPIISASDVTRDRKMPSKPMVMVLLNKLKQDGILKSLREAAGPRPQVLALAELVNLCEGKKVI